MLAVAVHQTASPEQLQLGSAVQVGTEGHTPAGGKRREKTKPVCGLQRRLHIVARRAKGCSMVCLSLKPSWRSRMIAAVSFSQQGMVFDENGFELYHVAEQPETRKALLEGIGRARFAAGGKAFLRNF